MRGLAEHLASSVKVQQPVWVGRLERRGPGAAPGAAGGGGWDLYGAGGRHLGVYDYVVIAHNGEPRQDSDGSNDGTSVGSGGGGGSG
jgi:hypothetical protein